jgi:hypothetical protein
MLLFWLKHYVPIHTLGALFGVFKTTAHRVVHKKMLKVANLTFASISMDFFYSEVSLIDFINCYSIINSTEVQIYAWKDQAFSGEKHMHTLKYQAVVGISSGKLLNLACPFCGSVHDSSIFQNTLISDWLTEKNGFLLGDKEYIGCNNIITPFKKKRGQQTLNKEQFAFNLILVSHKIKVENYFAHGEFCQMLIEGVFPFTTKLFYVV